jgi:hypothetical protein
MLRTVGIAGTGFLLVYAVPRSRRGSARALGDVAQLFRRLRRGFTCGWRRCRGQVRVFWNMNAAHGWCGRRPGCGPTRRVRAACRSCRPPTRSFSCRAFRWRRVDGRPEQDRPRWLFDIVLLDLILIALFGRSSTPILS